MEEKKRAVEARALSIPGSEAAMGAARHSLQVFGREQVRVEGVLAVESYDDREIIMETDMGVLTLKGEELNITQLDLESGRFAVSGYINSCVYSTPRTARGGGRVRSRSFLERLLR